MFNSYHPSKRYQQHALPPGCSGLWRRRAVRAPLGDAAAPFRWRTGSMDGGASRRSLVGSSRLVPPCRGWAWQTLARVQPVQLVRAFGGGPPPHGMTHHDSLTPPRRARPTRRAPHPSQAVRWSWHCRGPPCRARCRLRARARRTRCARRDCPGAPLDSPTPPRRARPTRRAPPPIAGGEIELGTAPCGEGRVRYRLRARAHRAPCARRDCPGASRGRATPLR